MDTLHGMPHVQVAYVSMEIAIAAELPTYSGGLGVLAGDLVRAAADASLPMVGITLLYREGYFRQRIDEAGTQHEEPEHWDYREALEPTTLIVPVTIAGRVVAARVWRHDAIGYDGARVPVYLLDTDVDGNDGDARSLTARLYGGDARHRLEQETLLGFGAVAVLRAFGLAPATYHLNEGHSALVVLALLEHEPFERVHDRCVFTTHTPVPAGHDRFSASLAVEVLGEERLRTLSSHGLLADHHLDMTFLALRSSRYANAVSARHAHLARQMHPGYEIHAVTNGVHAATWTSAPFHALFERHVPGWRRDNTALREINALPLDEIWQAHAEAKRTLVERVAVATGIVLDPAAFTIGAARRATAYKRLDLVLRDPQRLRAMARRHGRLQLLFAGKAHPCDDAGKAQIAFVREAARALAPHATIIFLDDYTMSWGAALTAGVDLWLNTPLPPNEASGTSGMKAALNGVPSLSVRDGWWVEGGFDGATGFVIDEETAADGEFAADALYTLLDQTILPLYARHRPYAALMRNAIAINGAHFTAQRMLGQYLSDAYVRRAVVIDLPRPAKDEAIQEASVSS
jgi:starch phosphorylase